jgi:hypothetical protein
MNHCRRSRSHLAKARPILNAIQRHRPLQNRIGVDALLTAIQPVSRCASRVYIQYTLCFDPKNSIPQHLTVTLLYESGQGTRSLTDTFSGYPQQPNLGYTPHAPWLLLSLLCHTAHAHLHQ